VAAFPEHMVSSSVYSLQSAATIPIESGVVHLLFLPSTTSSSKEEFAKDFVKRLVQNVPAFATLCVIVGGHFLEIVILHLSKTDPRGQSWDNEFHYIIDHHVA
jgi:hypothetical protein